MKAAGPSESASLFVAEFLVYFFTPCKFDFSLDLKASKPAAPPLLFEAEPAEFKRDAGWMSEEV